MTKPLVFYWRIIGCVFACGRLLGFAYDWRSSWRYFAGIVLRQIPRSNLALNRTAASGVRLALRYVSGERGLSYQVSPQWATFAAPSGVRGRPPQPAAGTCRGRAVWLHPHSSAQAVRPASWRPANHRFGSTHIRIQVLCPLLPPTRESRCFMAPALALAGRLPRRTEAAYRKSAARHQKRGCASPSSWCTLAAVPKAATNVVPIGFLV